jgi:TonB family protein
MRAALARHAALAALAALALGASADVPRPRVAGPSPAWIDGVPAPAPLEERLAEIRRRVQEAVVYPPLARRRGLEGVAHVQFAIGGDGRAAAVATVRSSGHAVLDRAAEQGARDAQGLPYVYGTVEVPVRFALERP